MPLCIQVIITHIYIHYKYNYTSTHLPYTRKKVRVQLPFLSIKGTTTGSRYLPALRVFD